MNTRNISITAMAAILVLGMTAMAFAGPGYGRGAGACGGPGYGMGYGNGYAQLTPEKQQAVDAISDKYDAKFDELRSQMWTKHSVLQAMVNAGNADEKKISSLVADISKLRDQMRDTRVAMITEIQKETGLNAFGPRFGQGRGQGPGQGRGPGMGFNGQGMGRGQGMGSYQGNGFGPCWN